MNIVNTDRASRQREKALAILAEAGIPMPPFALNCGRMLSEHEMEPDRKIYAVQFNHDDPALCWVSTSVLVGDLLTSIHASAIDPVYDPLSSEGADALRRLAAVLMDGWGG